jgi:hypothetical protein
VWAYLLQELLAPGICTDLVHIDDGETLVNIMVMDECSGIISKLNELEPLVSGADIVMLLDRIQQRASGAGHEGHRWQCSPRCCGRYLGADSRCRPYTAGRVPYQIPAGNPSERGVERCLRA